MKMRRVLRRLRCKLFWHARERYDLRSTDSGFDDVAWCPRCGEVLWRNVDSLYDPNDEAPAFVNDRSPFGF